MVENVKERKKPSITFSIASKKMFKKEELQEMLGKEYHVLHIGKTLSCNYGFLSL